MADVSDNDLQVGDLVVYVGKPEHSTLDLRVIYQVVSRQEHTPSVTANLEVTQYPPTFKLRPVFDIAHPMGHDLETTSRIGTRGMRKLTVIDLGTIRLLLDDFIRRWSREQGHQPPEVTTP